MAGGGNQLRLIKKLQTACNTVYGKRLCWSISQFYSEQQGRTIPRYSISEQITDGSTGKYSREELFSSYSLIKMVFFMRDYWFLLNGLELPDDNEEWLKVRKDTILENGKLGKKEEG